MNRAPIAVKEAVKTLSQKVKKAQDLTAASLVQLDNDMRIVYANTVRTDAKKAIGEVQIRLDALLEIMTLHFTEEQKAMFAEAEANVRAMRAEMDEKYLRPVDGKRPDGDHFE
ncbi:hypothetical protein N0V88_006969 [Collariella sp. IMI 366227]|nr:hypothetical protein N0V88_006969 [Collariella sp. IMI 366227]